MDKLHLLILKRIMLRVRRQGSQVKIISQLAARIKGELIISRVVYHLLGGSMNLMIKPQIENLVDHLFRARQLRIEITKIRISMTLEVKVTNQSIETIQVKTSSQVMK